MINLNVDEGYAFDYLSILEVKFQNINSLETSKSFDSCKSFLKSQMSPDLFDLIYESKEYNECKVANQLTFDAVEKARYGNISAKEVDDCNMRRYNAKINLQKRFFKNEVSECKT